MVSNLVSSRGRHAQHFLDRGRPSRTSRARFRRSVTIPPAIRPLADSSVDTRDITRLPIASLIGSTPVRREQARVAGIGGIGNAAPTSTATIAIVTSKRSKVDPSRIAKKAEAAVRPFHP
jgi:hypothetical protein